MITGDRTGDRMGDRTGDRTGEGSCRCLEISQFN